MAPGTSKGCPNCGSRRFKFAPAEASADGKTGLFEMRDRICRDCGTRYKPPMPAWLPYLIALMGVLFAFMGVALMFAPMKGPLRFRTHYLVLMILAGLAIAGAGIWKLTRPKA